MRRQYTNIATIVASDKTVSYVCDIRSGHGVDRHIFIYCSGLHAQNRNGV